MLYSRDMFTCFKKYAITSMDFHSLYLQGFPTMFKSLVSLSVAGLLLTACSDTTLGTKSFEEALDQIEIPGAPLGLGELTLPQLAFDLNLSEQEGYSSLSVITSVNVRSATFTVSPNTDDPALDQFADNNPDNFDFLSSITLSLRATIDGTSRTVQVASLPEGDPQIGSNATVLNLVVDDVDIRDFVEAPDVQLLVSATGTIPVDFVIIDPVLNFRVGIGVR